MNWKKGLFIVCVLYVAIFILFHLGIFSANQSQKSAGASILSPNTSLSLITEPTDGIAPLLSAINSATTSIDLVMYELNDTQIEQALASTESRGVAVRVLLNGGYYGKQESSINKSAYSYFIVHNVPVRWTPKYFALTHQKTLIVDRNDALIMTFNLTPQYYASSRDFGIDDKNQSDVSAIENAFDSDWQASGITPSQGNDLVWSPNSEDELLTLINSATTTIEIYNEEMADTNIIDALESSASRGVDVEVDMTYSSEWKKAFQELSSAGVHIRTYASNAPLYIHAKMILVDGYEAFVGSENFSFGSLYNNRELGILINDPDILGSLGKIFANDWQNATPYQ